MRLSLTKRGQYAVRLAQHLAALPPGTRMTAGDLGAACAVPPGNIPTVVSLLSRAGVLECSPGRRGGCRLARPAGDISVLEVVEAVEGPLGTRCVFDARRCGIDGECALHPAWSVGREAVLAALSGLTLAAAAGGGGALDRP